MFSPNLFSLGFASMLWLSPSLADAAEEAYRLNPGDKIEISVWQEENLHMEVVVPPDGTISFPLAGQMPAAGKTTEELARLLRDRLGQFIPSPQVNIRLVAAEGNTIYVIGEVVHPGAIVMKGRLDVMQGLSMAGGLTQFAKRNDIQIFRREANGHIKTFPFEYSEVEDGEELRTIIQLQSGDTIVVP